MTTLSFDDIAAAKKKEEMMTTITVKASTQEQEKKHLKICEVRKNFVSLRQRSHKQNDKSKEKDALQKYRVE